MLEKTACSLYNKQNNICVLGNTRFISRAKINLVFPRTMYYSLYIQLIQLRLSFQKRKLSTMSAQGMMDCFSCRRKYSGNYLCSK